MAITEPQRVVAVFRDAVEVIRKDGWITLAERDTDPRFRAFDDRRTLVEAIEWVVPWDGQTPRLVVAFLRRRLGTHDLDAWNEAPGRTVADVLAALSPDPRTLREEARTRQEIHKPDEYVFDANEPVTDAEDAAATTSALDDLAAWGHQNVVDAGGGLSVEAAKASARSRRRSAGTSDD